MLVKSSTKTKLKNNYRLSNWPFSHTFSGSTDYLVFENLKLILHSQHYCAMPFSLDLFWPQNWLEFIRYHHDRCSLPSQSPISNSYLINIPQADDDNKRGQWTTINQQCIGPSRNGLFSSSSSQRFVELEMNRKSPFQMFCNPIFIG